MKINVKEMLKVAKINTKLFFKKNGSHILIGAGLVSWAAATVTAAKASLDAGYIFESVKEDRTKIATCLTENPDDYSKKDAAHDKLIMYYQFGYRMVKHYWVPVLLATAGTVSILAGYGIMKKKYVEMATAYVVLDRSFKEYRNRVKDRYGEEEELKIFHNEVEAESEETNPETGEVTTKNVRISQYSDMANFFDDTCPTWVRNAEDNRMFVEMTRNYIQDLLMTRADYSPNGIGVVFVNEIKDAFHFQRMKKGQEYGYIWDKNNPNNQMVVDFGIMNPDIGDGEAKRAFVNGWEKSVIIDYVGAIPVSAYLDAEEPMDIKTYNRSDIS